MKHLVFAPGERVRAATWEERSLLPVSAACVVANAMRERLSALARSDVDLRLWPPAIPQSDAWDVILHGASVHVVRGTLSDAAIVLRSKDAHALAAMLFGERSWEGKGVLSALESEITRRAVAALAAALVPVCGETALPSRDAAIDALTYFELHVIAPVAFSMGVALSREPQSRASATIAADALAASLVDLDACLPLVAMTAAEIAALRAGDVLGVSAAPAVVRVHGEEFARGDCGVSGERFALRLAARE